MTLTKLSLYSFGGILILSLIVIFINRDDRLLMKCANKNYKDSHGLTMSNNLQKNFNFDKKYIKIYQDCEFQLNNSPKTFKTLYK